MAMFAGIILSIIGEVKRIVGKNNWKLEKQNRLLPIAMADLEILRGGFSFDENISRASVEDQGKKDHHLFFESSLYHSPHCT